MTSCHYNIKLPLSCEQEEEPSRVRLWVTPVLLWLHVADPATSLASDRVLEPVYPLMETMCINALLTLININMVCL